MISSDTLAFLKKELKETEEYCKYRSLEGTPQNINDIWSQIRHLNQIIQQLILEIEESQLEQE